MRLSLLVLVIGCAPKDDAPGETGADSAVDSADSTGDSADSTVDSGDSAVDSGDSTGDSGDSGAIEIPADNVALALGDCQGYYRKPDEYPNQLAEGHELQRYTLHEPEAVCNDGTRAVMYVRAATNPDLAAVWSIHLQGGGSCGSWLSCAARWCGAGYYDSSKMSSADLPLEVNGFGIADAQGENILLGANQAWFYYCSSDGWRGVGSAAYDSDDIEIEGVDPDDLPFELPDYTLFRRGHTILEAGLDELAGGVVADGGEALPPLTDATLVVFSGTSAGSAGARTNADWVNERLSADGARVVAIFDAANTPAGEFWAPKWEHLYQDYIRQGWEQTVASETPLPFTDQSCLDALGGTADEWRCWQAEYLMLHHITTPFFVRQDLRDITDAAEATGIPEDEYEAAVGAMLAAMSDLPATAAETIPVAPGAYGPNCAQHVALESTPWWTDATVSDDAGAAWSYQDAALAWAQGGAVAVIDEPLAGEGDGPRSACVKTDEER